jgi:hypothetical protein
MYWVLFKLPIFCEAKMETTGSVLKTTKEYVAMYHELLKSRSKASSISAVWMEIKHGGDSAMRKSHDPEMKIAIRGEMESMFRQFLDSINMF